MLQQLQMKFKEYDAITTTRVDLLFAQDFDNWRKNGRKISAIAGLVPKDFKAVFGKHSFIFDGWRRRRLYTWVFEYKGETFFFTTANERGTSIEATTTDKQILSEVIEEFLEKFKDNKSVQEILNFNPYKKAKNSDEARDIQETYKGKPHGWVQWKGTDVCMDIHCKCGHHSHVDADFAYYVKCPACGTVYMCNGHIELIEIEEEPDNRVITPPLD